MIDTLEVRESLKKLEESIKSTKDAEIQREYKDIFVPQIINFLFPTVNIAIYLAEKVCYFFNRNKELEKENIALTEAIKKLYAIQDRLLRNAEANKQAIHDLQNTLIVLQKRVQRNTVELQART